MIGWNRNFVGLLSGHRQSSVQKASSAKTNTRGTYLREPRSCYLAGVIRCFAAHRGNHPEGLPGPFARSSPLDRAQRHQQPPRAPASLRPRVPWFQASHRTTSVQPTLPSTSVARQTNLSPHFAVPPPLWKTTRRAAWKVVQRRQKTSRRPNLRTVCTTGWWSGVGQSERQTVKLTEDVVWTSGDRMVRRNPGRGHPTE